MKRIFFILFLIGVINQVGRAQNLDKARLDSYFDVLEASNKFMGSLAVSKDDKIIYTRSVGFADFENKVKAGLNTKYRIGSISKTFTAVLALKAVEEKKLDLDQTIDRYFPGVKNADKITVRHLLNHRSGIHSFTADANYLNWYTQPKTEGEMTEIIIKGGSDFEPGSKFEYSNSNFVLLTYLLQKIFKQSYSDLLKKYITQPLGLRDTYLGGKINPAKNESRSYQFKQGTWMTEPETDISIPLGAGGIVSTPADLVKFSNALFGHKLLTAGSLEIMKGIKDNGGIGLFKIPFYDKQGYGHTGGIDGFSSAFWHFSDGDVSYALTSNGTSYNNNSILIAVLSAVYNKAYENPVFYEVNEEELDQYLGVYASPQHPLKITFTRDGKTLVAQATGQPSFPLEAIGENKFKFDQAGLTILFNPKEKTMQLNQNGGQFLFKKE